MSGGCSQDGPGHMTGLFRNVKGSPLDPVETWPYEGMVSVIEYGTLRDWQPLIRHVTEHPWGKVARKLEQYLGHADDNHVTAYFRTVLHQLRANAEAAERDAVAARVRECIERSGLSAGDFATSIGTSASRLSTYARGSVTPSAALILRMEKQAGLLAHTPTPQGA